MSFSFECLVTNVDLLLKYKIYRLVSRTVYFYVSMLLWLPYRLLFICLPPLIVCNINWCWFRFEITIYRVVIRKYIFMFSCFHVNSLGFKLVTLPHFINLGKQGLNIFMHLEKTWKHENMSFCLEGHYEHQLLTHTQWRKTWWSVENWKSFYESLLTGLKNKPKALLLHHVLQKKISKQV